MYAAAIYNSIKMISRKASLTHKVFDLSSDNIIFYQLHPFNTVCHARGMQQDQRTEAEF